MPLFNACCIINDDDSIDSNTYLTIDWGVSVSMVTKNIVTRNKTNWMAWWIIKQLKWYTIN